MIKENDWGTHIRLKVDSQYADTINQVNVDKQGGNLVVEIVCAFEVTQADAIDACSRYENKIPVPKVNDHVGHYQIYVCSANGRYFFRKLIAYNSLNTHL